MHGRSAQCFAYTLERPTKRKRETGITDRWDDPDTMDCSSSWLLPNVFPAISSFSISLNSMSITNSAALASNNPGTGTMRVLHIPDLLGCILSAIIEPVPKQTHFSDDSQTLSFLFRSIVQRVLANTSTITSSYHVKIFSYLLHGSKRGCSHAPHLTISNGQNRILPSRSPSLSTYSSPIFAPQPRRDWRACLLVFLCNATNADPHIKNRWRMSRMMVREEAARSYRRALEIALQICRPHCSTRW
jgi:hypothetical protein